MTCENERALEKQRAKNLDALFRREIERKNTWRFVIAPAALLIGGLGGYVVRTMGCGCGKQT